MPWMGAAIAGGVGIVGDIMSQSGQQAANVMSMNEMMQQEQWQTQMSDTAMQRRVADLKAAGLNPMLAVNSGGATVGGVGTPSLQNPAQAFAGAGGQATNAMQLQSQASQIQQQKASADKAESEAALNRSTLPYSGASAQAALDNLRRTNDNLTFQAFALERDYELSQRSLPQLMENPTFASQLQALKLQATEVDLQRQQLGLPRLANDAMWQKEHPEISGWMQSGVPQGALDVVNSAAKVAGQMSPVGRIFGRR